jgi:hypothetical protein
MKIHGRPLTGAVPKPKIGFTAKEHAEVGYETWMGGFDFVKDDENLTSTSFNRFDERVRLMTKMRNKAEQETGERKSAFINITADTETMKKRAQQLADAGWNYAMIDVVVAGTASVMTMRDYCSDLGLAIHAHRAMHAAFDRSPKHGITMQFLAKLMRLVGVSQIHSGTAVGKLVGTKQEATLIADVLREQKTKGFGTMLLDQDWGSIKNAFPVSCRTCSISTAPILFYSSRAASTATRRARGPGPRRRCRRSRPGRKASVSRKRQRAHKPSPRRSRSGATTSRYNEISLFLYSSLEGGILHNYILNSFMHSSQGMSGFASTGGFPQREGASPLP